MYNRGKYMPVVGAKKAFSSMIFRRTLYLRDIFAYYRVAYIRYWVPTPDCQNIITDYKISTEQDFFFYKVRRNYNDPGLRKLISRIQSLESH